MDTTTQQTKPHEYVTLDAIGHGTIQAGASQQDRLDEFTGRVAGGEFHRPTSGLIPNTCIDGRCGGTDGLMPNAAGGTESLMVADDLTTKRFTQDGMSTCAQYGAVLRHLAQAGYPVGGHTAADCHGAPSGCGANDKLPAIYAYIADSGDTLRQLATGLLGYTIPDDDHQLIVRSAAARTEFSRGDELLQVLRRQDGRVDVLQGEHTEVLAVINRRAGTTLDRDAVRDEFGDQYEAFNVDEWSFEKGAQLLSEDDIEARQKRTAMLYYNLATAGVLCGPAMRVAVLA